MSDDDHMNPDETVDVPTTPEAQTSGDAGTRARAADSAAPARRPKRERTSPRQFLREVRSELRKVAWPSRKELFSYSLVVLVSVSLITLYIAGLDQLFGTLILRIFSS
ncbi:MAG: preprotein translocase subunit SecE [Nitriliruptorales bacterium]|nr:preprotein translocase subunit SecE [Nitriliruptorales bacterium]